MNRLVALDLPGGPDFVDALRAVWDQGDAAAPLDPRLPLPAARTLLGALAPDVIIGPDGSRSTRPFPAKGTARTGRPVEPGDALVVATSGSTGLPRGVVLTHDAVAASARATTEALRIDPGRHRWLACLPLAHIGGLAVVTRALLTGTPLTVLPGFDAEQVDAAVATHVSLVATALRRIDPARWAAILLGGAAPPHELPANVVTTYGMTETGSGIVYDGRPLDGVEITTSPDGELLVRGPMLFRQYRDGDRDQDPFLPGGWFPTGDGGRIDADGRVEVHGRLAEVIVTGGEKVWPAAVERVLSTHPAVADVAVWKRPDPEWGERVVAWVIPRDPAMPPTLQVLRELTAATLAPWASPKELEIVASVPRTPSGKLRRRGLT